MLALTIFKDAQQARKPLNFNAIYTKTQVTKSSVYKLCLKAISRNWVLDKLVKLKHINDIPYLSCPKTLIAIALFIIKITTQNFIIRGQLYACIIVEVIGAPGRQPVLASTIYKVLTKNSYSAFKRIVKLSLTKEIKKSVSCLVFRA